MIGGMKIYLSLADKIYCRQEAPRSAKTGFKTSMATYSPATYILPFYLTLSLKFPCPAVLAATNFSLQLVYNFCPHLFQFTGVGFGPHHGDRPGSWIVAPATLLPLLVMNFLDPLLLPAHVYISPLFQQLVTVLCKPFNVYITRFRLVVLPSLLSTDGRKPHLQQLVSSSNLPSSYVKNFSHYHGSLPNLSSIGESQPPFFAPGAIFFPRHWGPGVQPQPLDYPLHDRRRQHQCAKPLSFLELAVRRQDCEMHTKESGGREYDQRIVAGWLHLRRTPVSLHWTLPRQGCMAAHEK